VADLAEGLRAHPAAVHQRFPGKAEAYPVVLGCVPWITSREVVDALLAIGNYCVVVDKSAYGPQLDRLSSEGEGVWQMLLRDLQDWGPSDEGGRHPVVHPYHMPGDRGLEPVRVVGWRQRGKEKVPLLHAKLAVCCAAYTWESDGGGWDDHLLPMSVWMGSANWTTASQWHIEFGAWSHDEALAKDSLDFLTAVIKLSEPQGSVAGRPSPELVAGEWDDDAFAELMSEYSEAEEPEPE